MRALVFATLLLASSSVYPSFAQEEGKVPVVPQTEVPAQTDQKFPQRQERTGRDQLRGDNREMSRDGRSGRGEGDRIGREDREGGPDRRMRRDRDMDRGRYSEQGDRDWDSADRESNRGYFDENQRRRRVKVCVEYENGDEYCRYRQ
jgi:hypothetical protein